MCPVPPLIPDKREAYPKKPEGLGEPGLGLLSLLDPVLVHGQLAFDCQKSCRHSGSRAQKRPDEGLDVRKDLPDEKQTAANP